MIFDEVTHPGWLKFPKESEGVLETMYGEWLNTSTTTNGVKHDKKELDEAIFSLYNFHYFKLTILWRVELSIMF